MDETKVLVDRIMKAVNALPADGRSAEKLARCVDQECRTFARETGMDPDIECDFREPGTQRHFPPCDGWTVVFEAGPYDWAIDASMEITCSTGVTVEPYYGFDLTFYREG